MWKIKKRMRQNLLPPVFPQPAIWQSPTKVSPGLANSIGERQLVNFIGFDRVRTATSLTVKEKIFFWLQRCTLKNVFILNGSNRFLGFWIQYITWNVINIRARQTFYNTCCFSERNFKKWKESNWCHTKHKCRKNFKLTKMLSWKVTK